MAEGQEWQPSVTPKLEDYQDHSTSCSCSKYTQIENKVKDRLKPLKGKVKDKPEATKDDKETKENE